MKICLRIKVVETGEYTEDYDSMMNDSGLDSRMGYEDIGLQGDGTGVIFDKCGKFGYLSDKYELVIMSDT